MKNIFKELKYRTWKYNEDRKERNNWVKAVREYSDNKLKEHDKEMRIKYEKENIKTW
jgi:hypothetical protein